jgi:hypothetical protein
MLNTPRHIPPHRTLIECAHNQQWSVADEIKINAGNYCTLNGVDHCDFTAGSDAVINCRNNCKILAGDSSTISTGNTCTVRTGRDSEVSVGPGSIVIAGDGSAIKFYWWLGDQETFTRIIIGEAHTRPNVPYMLRNGLIEAVN